MKRLGKRWRKNKDEPEASVTSFFSSFLWGLPAPPRAAAGAESSSGGMPSLCGEQEEEKKETYPPAGTSLQVQTDRRNSSCKEIPAGVGSSDLFAQRDGLCVQLHVVYPGRYNYSCSSVPASLYL